jgi:hypothetical protein
MDSGNLLEISADDYYYHATYKPYIKSIKLHGLHGDSGNKNWDGSEPGKVYLAKHPDVARSYAETSDDVPDSYINDIRVLKVHKKHLDPKKIHADRNARGSKDTIEYHGKIPPQHLEDYERE